MLDVPMKEQLSGIGGSEVLIIMVHGKGLIKLFDVIKIVIKK